jgi:hypothetical protein
VCRRTPLESVPLDPNSRPPWDRVVATFEPKYGAIARLDLN